MKRSQQIPSARLASFDVLAEKSREGNVVIACTSREVRRQYQREIAKRGGLVDRLRFVIWPAMPDNAADVLRAGGQVEPSCQILDVRDCLGARRDD
jgi:hypothetical protein